jgi:pSer/pThr/pTyr-binding forkhead associated (FHA) protein
VGAVSPVLRSIEQKIESLFEGAFGRAFRRNVQPVELARKLAKEMDDYKMVSVSRVYAPNEYVVYLSPGDRAQFESYEPALIKELEQYLAEHGRREGYVLLSKPQVTFESDEDLEVGLFGIANRMIQREAGQEPEPAPEPGATRIYRAVPAETEAASAEELGIEPEPEPPATLVVDGRSHELDKPSALIGRSKDCDIRVSDPNVSRRHAEIRQEGSSFWIVDLDSTNGVSVNGRAVKRAKLDDEDRITLGSTELVFRRSDR